MYDLMIIGAGPAGMTAALYGARAGRSVLLFEAEAPGGQILNSPKIENYPALPQTDGYTFSENLRQQLPQDLVTVVSEKVTQISRCNGLFCAHTGNEIYSGRKLILATGLKHRKLGVPGEESLLGKGVSFCATCDGMFFRKKEVAVLGGGNTAVQDALYLAEICSRVYLIHRRAELRAEQWLVDRMRENEKITFIGETVVEEMCGAPLLQALKLQNTVTKETRELPVSGVFEAIGLVPQHEMFGDLITTDKDGYILTDERCAAATPGVYAAGDCRAKTVRQLTTATADGTVAALAAVEDLRREGL
ncbi:MAG: FAD-dependent oxidoreductase [Clostridia bacterium]|nr:FAD-dependent oxidoreductase [Clostridia bacterium]